MLINFRHFGRVIAQFRSKLINSGPFCVKIGQIWPILANFEARSHMGRYINRSHISAQISYGARFCVNFSQIPVNFLSILSCIKSELDGFMVKNVWSIMSFFRPPGAGAGEFFWVSLCRWDQGKSSRCWKPGPRERPTQVPSCIFLKS